MEKIKTIYVAGVPIRTNSKTPFIPPYLREKAHKQNNPVASLDNEPMPTFVSNVRSLTYIVNGNTPITFYKGAQYAYDAENEISTQMEVVFEKKTPTPARFKRKIIYKAEEILTSYQKK